MSVLDRVQTGGRGGVADRLLAEAAAAGDAARDLAAAAAAGLFAAPVPGLHEVRLAVAGLLAGLVAAIEDDLRQRLLERLGSAAPDELVATLATAEVAVAAPILDRARLLGDPELVAVLLRRAEEQRLAAALRPAAPPAPPLFDEIMQGGDEVAAGLAMALLVAESRARPYGRVDLPAELQHRLTWWVAAALRRYALDRSVPDPVGLDRALAAVAAAALAAHDEGDGVEARAMQLARRLHARGRLDDALVLRAVAEGRVVLAVALLAVRAGLDFVPAWEMAADPTASRLTVLLRAGGIDRSPAAAIVQALAEASGADANDVAEWIEAFAWLDPDAARAAIAPWALDPGYARAIAELDAGLRPR